MFKNTKTSTGKQKLYPFYSIHIANRQKKVQKQKIIEGYLLTNATSIFVNKILKKLFLWS